MLSNFNINDIKFIIDFTIKLLNSTVIDYGIFRFSMMQVVIGAICFSVAIGFVFKFFDI